MELEEARKALEAGLFTKSPEGLIIYTGTERYEIPLCGFNGPWVPSYFSHLEKNREHTKLGDDVLELEYSIVIRRGDEVYEFCKCLLLESEETLKS